MNGFEGFANWSNFNDNKRSIDSLITFLTIMEWVRLLSNCMNTSNVKKVVIKTHKLENVARW